MTRRPLFLFALLIGSIAALNAQIPATHVGVSESLATSGVAYVENRGQWDERARYHLRTQGLDLWLSDNAVVYDLNRCQPDTNEPLSAGEMMFGDSHPGLHVSGHVVRMAFVHASKNAAAHGVDRSAGYHNYFIGDDSNHWVSYVPLYSSVKLERLYDGVDAAFYIEQGRARYDLIVAPGADPHAIAMRFEGAGKPRVEEDGSLAVETSVGALRQDALRAYQIVDGVRRDVRCAFMIRNDGTVGFDLGEYDRSSTLVIDPLVYSTFLGGSDMNSVTGMSLDSSGNVYVVGATKSSDFPTTTGAYQSSFNKLTSSTYYAVVTKINASGSALVFSTFLGGTASNENGQGIALDTARNIYLTGLTTSSSSTNNFPTTSGAYITTRPGGGGDVFVAKLNASGSSLLYSTYLGGPGTDAGSSIVVDIQGNAYVTGQTDSFPTTSGAYSRVYGGSTDNFVMKLNASGSAPIYSTYLGGSSFENPTGIAIDSAGNAYIIGRTGSSNYPTTTGAFDRSLNTTYDSFITKLNASGSSLVYSTYLSGSAQGIPRKIVVGPDGTAYVCGWTLANDFPTTTGAYATSTTSNGVYPDGYVTRLNASGTGLIYSTYITTNAYDVTTSLAIDKKGNAYVTGMTASSNFPTTTTAFDRTHNGADDLFVLKLNYTGSGLLYSTFIGGSNDEYVADIKIDAAGYVYVVGISNSTNFPKTQGAYDTTNNTNKCFILKLPVPGVILTSPIGNEVWCSGTSHPITWTSNIVDSVSIELSTDGGATFNTLAPRIAAALGSWNWAIPSTQPQASNYRIRIYDPTNLSMSDTSRAFTINRPPTMSVPPSGLTLCPGQPATFTVTASGVGLTYQWRKDLANIQGATGTSFTIPSVQPADAGTYDVVVTGACPPSSTSSGAILRVNAVPQITAQPRGDTVCQGNSVTFNVGATGTGLVHQWRKDGANISGATNPSYPIFSPLPAHTGIYDVVVSGTCSPPDTSDAVRFLVIPSPVITTQPASVAICPGDSVTFSIAATGTGLTYQWRKNGNDIPGATTTLLTLTNVQPSDSGSYDVLVSGSCPSPLISNAATLTVNLPPAIVRQPSNISVCPGQPATLAVTSAGALLKYQWRRNGAGIPGATGALLTINSVSPADTGSYDVVITGKCPPSITSSSATLAITQATTISVTSQLHDTSLCVGGKLILTVTASGASLTYQWRKNGVILPGVNSSSVVITSVGEADSGRYDVIIGSPCGNPDTSRSATVTINRPPSISMQPQDQTVNRGGPVTFSVVAGGGSLAYQWRKDGAAIAGSNNSSYTIASVSIADSGSYDVIVSGLCGSPLMSRSAVLKVLDLSAVPGTDEFADGISGSGTLIVVPHPAHGLTQLAVRMPQGIHPGQQTELALYDIMGQRSLDLSDSFERHAYEGAEFDAGTLASGIYYCRLMTLGWNGTLGIVIVVK